MDVKELIELLQKYNPEDLVIIDDADTNWELNIQEIRSYGNGKISISGSYDDILSK